MAPFSNESEAEDFVKSKGLSVRAVGGSQNRDTQLLRQLLDDRLKDGRGASRSSILVSHDASMIAHISAANNEPKPLFVTADRRLISALADSPYSQVISSIVFPHQAFTMAQMAGRANAVVRGLARTVFGVGSETSKQIREFYIDRVLGEYEPALAAEVPTIVNAILERAADFSAGNGVAEDYGKRASSDRLQRFKALDQFEGEFHSLMSAAKRKYGL